MKILEDRYTEKKNISTPFIVFCRECQSKLEIEDGDFRCNKRNDIGVCLEITFECPLCKKMNWVSL